MANKKQKTNKLVREIRRFQRGKDKQKAAQLVREIPKEQLTLKRYNLLFKCIKAKILAAQYKSLRLVNKELISLYWDIGGIILIQQKETKWGKSAVEMLAKDLQEEFPGIKGFSASNLWRMRVFYQEYCKNTKLAPLVREISWAHNLIIMEKCKNDLEREFYIRVARKFGWTKDVLIHQIENQTYEKTLLNKTNFEATLPARITKQAKLAVKDEYTFDFLELGAEHSEKQLEQAALAKIRKFLHEMGGLFAFVDSQYRIEINGEEYPATDYKADGSIKL